MKKIFTIIFICSVVAVIHAQNYISGPQAVYGPQYNAATTIAFGGSILVGNGGNWFFAGNISSADKGNPNTTTAMGRTESITFSGTGTYTGAALVDGYVATSGKTAAFVMPVGIGTTAYPITVPAGATITAAYFFGLGTIQTMPVAGTSTTIYSPYIDLPNGLTSGTYTFSYPAGFNNNEPSKLLSKNGTTYSLLASVSNFLSTPSTTLASLAASGATQIYFGSSNGILPVNFISFTGLANGCMVNLNWQTGSENNSSYYAIENSLDGNNFTEIGKATSKNNLAGAAYTYAYKLSSSISYFRLKAVDIDGTISYSQTIAVNGTDACNASMLVKVSPNPTSDLVYLQGLIAGSHITLLNTSGQKITTVTANATTQAISLARYASGVYLLLIQSPNGTINNVKVVKN